MLTSHSKSLDRAIHSFEYLFYVFTPEGTFDEWNNKFTSVIGYSDSEISDLTPTDIVPEAEREDVTAALQTVNEDSKVVTFSTELETKTGNRIPYELQWAPLDNTERNESAVAGIGHDITDSDRPVNGQQMANDSGEISVPIVEIRDGILLSTVVSKLSAAQAEIFTEALLNRIAERGASVAIIDITGAEAVDTQTAQHLIDTIHAVKLMGGQTIITGLNPDISQTLVKLGVGFDVETQSSLQNGLKTALEIQGVSLD